MALHIYIYNSNNNNNNNNNGQLQCQHTLMMTMMKSNLMMIWSNYDKCVCLLSECYIFMAERMTE